MWLRTWAFLGPPPCAHTRRKQRRLTSAGGTLPCVFGGLYRHALCSGSSAPGLCGWASGYLQTQKCTSDCAYLGGDALSWTEYLQLFSSTLHGPPKAVGDDRTHSGVLTESIATYLRMRQITNTSERFPFRSFTCLHQNANKHL